MSLKFLINRLIYTFFMFLFVLVLNFLIFRLMPGDPVAMLSKELASNEASKELLMAKYGLNKSMPEQFMDYASGLVTGDFGDSFHFKKPVAEVIKPRIKNSVILGACAVPFGIFLGVAGGIIAASKRGKKRDIAITTSTMFIYAIPSFWLGMIMLSIFGVKLRWIPLGAMLTPGATYATTAAYIKDLAHHLIAPSITYALAMYGSYLLIMRGSMIDIYTEDFILTARAKGLTDGQITRRHAVPNALLPVVTMIVITFATMFAGAFSIEVLFSWPGMGRLMVDSVARRDYPVMQAINFIIAVAVILANFLIDILYRYIDPRVKLD